MTGSLGGGLVVGLAAGMVGAVIHAAAAPSKADEVNKIKAQLKVPHNAAVLFGRIRQSVGTVIRPPEEQRVIVVASSDKAESPLVLFDAALRKFVDVYENGAKANLAISMDKPQVTTAVKDEAQK